jgi:phage protein
MTNTILSKFDNEMSKPHTDTEDRIHNWLVDNQDDQELMEGLKKDLEPKRTIKGAMDYAIYKASQMLVGPRSRAMGSMVDDSVAHTWFKEYFTTENLVMGPIDGLVHAQVNTTPKPKPAPKPKKKKSTVDDNQLDLFSDF